METLGSSNQQTFVIGPIVPVVGYGTEDGIVNLYDSSLELDAEELLVAQQEEKA